MYIKHADSHSQISSCAECLNTEPGIDFNLNVSVHARGSHKYIHGHNDNMYKYSVS